jgi:hypothetical protein
MRFAAWVRRFQLITRSTQSISQRRTGARQVRRAHVPAVRRLEDRSLPSTVTWTGAAGDFNWDTAGNWDSRTVPGPSDDVFIETPGITVNHTNALALDSVASLNSDALIAVAAGSLSITGSPIQPTNFYAGLTMSGGQVTVGFGVSSLSVASIDVSAGAFADDCFAGTAVANVTLSGGALSLGGNLTVTNNLTMSGGTLTAGTANVTVAHSLDWSGGTIAGYPYQSLGITYPQGTVTVDGKLVLGAANAASNNEILDGTTLINNYDGGGYSGVDLSSQWLGEAGSFTQKNGSVFQNNAGDVFDINCSLPWNSDGTGTINNLGIIDKTSALPGTATLYSQLTNSGYIDVEPGETLSLRGGGTESGTFHPFGTLGFDGGFFTLTSTSVIDGTYSAGTVEFGGGTVTPTNVNEYGTYKVPQAGATVVDDGGVYFYSPVADIGGSLTIGGSPDLQSLVSLVVFETGAPVTLSNVVVGFNGVLAGADTLNVSGQLTWVDGEIGPATINIGPTASLVIGANDNLDHYEKCQYTTFNNYGSATFVGDGWLGQYDGAQSATQPGTSIEPDVFNNEPGATLDIEGIVSWYDLGNPGIINPALTTYPAAFNNLGTLIQSTGAYYTKITTPFHNSGSVNVQAGTLKIAGGGTHTGSFYVGANGELLFQGTQTATTRFLPPSNVSGPGGFDVSADPVTEDGTYNITGTTTVDGGSLTFTNPVTSVGALTVSGGTAAFSGGAPVPATSVTVTGGTLAGSDPLNVSGAVTVTGGSLTDSGNITANSLVVGTGTEVLQGQTLNVPGGRPSCRGPS